MRRGSSASENDVAVVRQQRARPRGERAADRKVERSWNVPGREIRRRADVDDRRAAGERALERRRASSSGKSSRGGAGGGPSRFTVFIVAKYFGGSGWSGEHLANELALRRRR